VIRRVFDDQTGELLGEIALRERAIVAVGEGALLRVVRLVKLLQDRVRIGSF
jgi:hypothetical protein